ncbi:MAG: 16S rRNA (cytidine1402-2'-O)-methyltransferase [Gammaproteobacteria bacterium]
MSIIKGALYIVATPIGNLEDLSPRAISVLKHVDLIVAEDTRHSKPMLNQFGIETKIRAYHDHNEREQTPKLIELLQQGQSIALISDAGTPLICDPGYHLLGAAHAEKIKVIPVPGASAMVSALSASGFSAEKFIFEGYLPAKQVARQTRMQALQTEERTMVFHEVPHRIIHFMEDSIDCFGASRQAVIAKEITKLHETIYRDSLENILLWLKEDAVRCKGEFVVVIQGEKTDQFDSAEAKRILQILLKDHSVKDAVKLATEILNGKKNELYKIAMDLKEN